MPFVSTCAMRFLFFIALMAFIVKANEAIDNDYIVIKPDPGEKPLHVFNLMSGSTFFWFWIKRPLGCEEKMGEKELMLWSKWSKE